MCFPQNELSSSRVMVHTSSTHPSKHLQTIYKIQPKSRDPPIYYDIYCESDPLLTTDNKLFNQNMMLFKDTNSPVGEPTKKHNMSPTLLLEASPKIPHDLIKSTDHRPDETKHILQNNILGQRNGFYGTVTLKQAQELIRKSRCNSFLDLRGRNIQPNIWEAVQHLLLSNQLLPPITGIDIKIVLLSLNKSMLVCFLSLTSKKKIYIMMHILEHISIQINCIEDTEIRRKIMNNGVGFIGQEICRNGILL